MNTNGKPKEDELELEEQGIVGLDGKRYVTDAPGLPEGMTLYKPSEDSGSAKNVGGAQGGSYSYKTSAPSYANRYQTAMDQAANALLNRKAFTYDHNTDPMYQQYKDSYTRQGQQAMEDTLAQVSARTGGLASSYAGTAAQQTYNGYMSALADKVPELRQLAYQMYMDEGDTMRQNLSMLQGLEQTDYNRYLDALGQWNDNRQFDYDAGQDAKNWAYKQHRDEVADGQYEQERTDEKALAAAKLLGQAGDFSGYQELLELSDEQVAALAKQFQEQNAPKVTGGGGEDFSMTLATAKAMAKQGQFTDDVLRVLRKAGFNDEYLKQEYGYGPETEQETEALTDNNEYNGRVYQKIYNQIKTGNFNVSTVAGMIERADLTDTQKDTLLTMLGY